jgi:hypothetical protein
MKLIFIIFSFFLLSAFVDKEELFNIKNKFDSFNSFDDGFISNRTAILKGSEYGFEEAKIIRLISHNVKKEKHKVIPGIKNYNFSFLDKNFNTVYTVLIPDPFNFYSHDSKGRRIVGLKKNPYIEIPIPELIEVISVRIEIMNKKNNRFVSKLNLIK